jgi:hypothetical protein
VPVTSAQRTLVKSPPEIWDIVADEGNARAWMRELTGVDGIAQPAGQRPEKALAWRGGDPEDPVRLEFALEEKGFGTQVSIRCDAGADAAVLDRMLDELGAPERRPFARD